MGILYPSPEQDAQRSAIKQLNLPLEAEAEALLQIDPNDPFVFRQRGVLLYNDGDHEAAEPILLRAALALPTDYATVFFLQQRAVETGDQTLAEHYLEIAAHRAGGSTVDTSAVRTFAKAGAGILKAMGLPASSEPRQCLSDLYRALAERRLATGRYTTPECNAMFLALSILDDAGLSAADLELALTLGPPLNLALTGLLREYALGGIGESLHDSIEVAAALLGATGGDFERRCLQELAENASPDVASAAAWALEEMRIRSLHLKPPLDRPTLESLCLLPDPDDGDEFDEDGDEFDDLDISPPPLPTPGRNDPCWCGSGKKYKKCHLELDAQERRHPEAPIDPVHSALLDRLGVHLQSATYQRERDSALHEVASGNFQPPDLTEAAIHHLIHIWIPKRLARTIAADFLLRHGQLLPAEQREILTAWVHSAPSLYEILKVEPGKGLLLKDLIAGAELFLHDIAISNRAVKHDGLFIHVAPSDRGHQALSPALAIPRPEIAAFLNWLHSDRQATGLDWPTYFRNNFLRIQTIPAALAAAPEISTEEPGRHAWLSAGPHLTHLADDFTSQQQLKLAAAAAPSKPKDDIPPEIQHAVVTQFLEKHMAAWPDTPLPALKGKTARQAVNTKAGRALVEQLLRDFENSEQHKKQRGEPWYDIDRVRKDLGLL